ncbi:hypothetical protein GCM10014713_53500 [Streptomyces purpureus]|uniref:Uncharacterized protein n=1 Tax=Streptomyces purpureus TaxID=1951 RepID=A0A918HCB2_9ACTN|nr:hypothetical protein GCM10014713_53500 [Streptomyces purpureus]
MRNSVVLAERHTDTAPEPAASSNDLTKSGPDDFGVSQIERFPAHRNTLVCGSNVSDPRTSLRKGADRINVTLTARS